MSVSHGKNHPIYDCRSCCLNLRWPTSTMTRKPSSGKSRTVAWASFCSLRDNIAFRTPQQNLQRVPARVSLSEYFHTSSRGIDSINQTATTYHSVKHWLSHRTRDNRFQSLTLLSTSMPFHSLSLMVTHSLWYSLPVCHWFYPFSPFWEESWLRFHYQGISWKNSWSYSTAIRYSGLLQCWYYWSHLD